MKDLRTVNGRRGDVRPPQSILKIQNALAGVFKGIYLNYY